jgi:hypothetical protein
MSNGSFPGIKLPGRGFARPPPSSAEVKERVELYIYSPSGPLWPVIGRALPQPFLPDVWNFVELAADFSNGLSGF